MLNEPNSCGQLCDLMTGDSQWIGGAAGNAWYVKLNGFFAAEGISMDAFVPATVTGCSEGPKNTPNDWSLPAFADVVGGTYRKNWFERPEIRAAFKEKTGRDLTLASTMVGPKDVAEFFQGREIDGKTIYGASISIERGSEGITKGAMNVLYSFFQYDSPDKPYELEGFVNSEASIAGLEFYKSLYDCCVAPGTSNTYMGEGIDAYKSGQVAMQMNCTFTWPGIEVDTNVGGGKTGYLVNPADPSGGRFAQLSGQSISVVANTDNMDGALVYSKWFAQQDVQEKWWSMGAFSCLRDVVENPGFASSQPYAQTFLDSTAIVGATEALKDVTMTIPDGAFVVLLGPTGAGKTTTQQYSLYPCLTVLENLAFPLRSRMIAIPEPDIAKRVQEVAEVLRIPYKLDNKATALSAGEMPRVSIGRALVRNPCIYLMDEPLSSLDAKLRADLRVELKCIHAEMGGTFVYVTHDQIGLRPEHIQVGDGQTARTTRVEHLGDQTRLHLSLGPHNLITLTEPHIARNPARPSTSARATPSGSMPAGPASERPTP